MNSTILLALLVSYSLNAFAVTTSSDVRPEAVNQLHPLPPSQEPIDLHEAIKRALANNNGIQQAREKIEQDREDTKVTRSYIFPNLSLVGTAGEFKNAVGSTGAATFGGDPYNQYEADLKLSQPLVAFGMVSAINVSKKNVVLNQLDLEIAERTLTNNVIQSFYKVLLNQRLLRNLEKVQKVESESLSVAQRRMRTGRSQLLDVLQVKTQLALLRPQIEDARNQLEAAGAQLATYLSENGKYYLELHGALKALQMKDVRPHIDTKKARLPELERLRVQRDQLEDQKWVTLGKHLPNLQLVGEYGAVAYKRSDINSPNARDWDVQLQLTIPLFSGFQSIYEQRSLTSQDKQIQDQTRDLENTLALQQVQSLKALQSTEASLASSQEAADLADQSENEANRNFRLTTIDFVQFLTVQQSTLQAYSALDNTLYNNIVAFSNYFVATGQPLDTLVELLLEKNK